MPAEEAQRQPPSPPPPQYGRQQPPQSFIEKLLSAILKGVLAFLIFRAINNLFFKTYIDKSSVQENGKDLYVYISPEAIQSRFPDKELILQKRNIIFGSFSEENNAELDIKYQFPIKLSASQPLFGHIYLAKKGFHPDPTRSKYDPNSISYKRINLVGSMPKPKETSNLISGEKSETSKNAESIKGEMVNYWYPEIRISLVQENGPIDIRSTPPFLRRQLSLTMNGKSYLPTIYLNEFWQLKDKRMILNNESFEAPLKIVVNTMGFVKFQIMTNFDHSIQVNEQIFGGDGETEKLKQMFIDTNPYLLILTLIVSTLHSIFDFLAFKNDIQFWKKKDNLQGLSVRSVLVNAAFQAIIFLYLLDQETSWLIIVSTGIGALIEFWKITKVLNIKFYFKGLLPCLEIKDKASYARTLTQEYDSLAMKYLGMVALPLLMGYSVYSLMYESHKGWYSWILGTLVGFVYTFGFIMMTPQLFINYKLKSVAHMPWRVFIYKALNTFIDDLFAFVIKMPTLHRLACFRDDIVFVIYLYQRWMYPVDKSRANEFGQVFEESLPAEVQGDIAEEGSEEKSTLPKEPKRTSLRSRKAAKS